MSEKKTMDKEALKKLREERRVWVENAKKSIKSQNQIIKQIKAQIADAAKTVPEIAQATGHADLPGFAVYCRAEKIRPWWPKPKKTATILNTLAS